MRTQWKDLSEEEKQRRVDAALEAFAADDSEMTAEEMLNQPED